MKEESLKLMRGVIKKWKSERNFTFEQKECQPFDSPIVKGESVLRFTNTLNSFFCNKQLISISLTSRLFHTSTLSDAPLSENANSDSYRLVKHLEEFDTQFYSEVESKLHECIETLTTSDPLLWV